MTVLELVPELVPVSVSVPSDEENVLALEPDSLVVEA